MTSSALQKKLAERQQKMRQENAKTLFATLSGVEVVGFTEKVGVLSTMDIWGDTSMRLDAVPSTELERSKPELEQLKWAEDQLSKIGPERDICVYFPLESNMPSGQWVKLRCAQSARSLATVGLVDNIDIIVVVNKLTGCACVIKVKENFLYSFERAYNLGH